MFFCFQCQCPPNPKTNARVSPIPAPSCCIHREEEARAESLEEALVFSFLNVHERILLLKVVPFC